MALAAGLIVVLIGRLFNRLALDVGIRPCVKLQPIKPDPLFAYGEFTNVGPDGFVENCPTHAQIAGRLLCSNESRD